MGCAFSRFFFTSTFSDGGKKSHTSLNAVADDPQYKPESTSSSRRKKRAPRYRDKYDARVIAKYDIKALIGRGSFSRVVRVEHKITKQPFAIKMIEFQGGRNLFESEVAVLRRVKHKYIIQLFEVFESKDRVYMVMELATGGELFERIIAKGHYTERDATKNIQMLLEGVKYLHSLGITHRDLKPENLLFYHPGEESKLLITDFGLSSCRTSGENQLMRTTCGTPEYIAPEILMRKAYTNAVDNWAVGVITYILLTGTMPFDDDNKARLYKSIIKANYSITGPYWKDISDDAKDFVQSLLVASPDIRMTANEAGKHHWITSNAAASSLKNLHRTVSSNLLEMASTRSRSTGGRSNRSMRSLKSNKSGSKVSARVTPRDLDAI